MPINRALILQQLMQQLQQQLGDTAETSLLEQTATPAAKPQVVLKLGDETIQEGQNPDAGLMRKLQLNVRSQALPDTPATVLQSLDTLAENIEMALSDKDKANLWMQIKPQKTGFDYTASNSQLNATMTQYFELEYLVTREDNCPAVPIKEIYLSNQGGPHELVAQIPTT